MSRKLGSLQRDALAVCASLARLGVDSLALAGAARMWLARARF
jgi:hypothetical protein